MRNRTGNEQCRTSPSDVTKRLGYPCGAPCRVFSAIIFHSAIVGTSETYGANDFGTGRGNRVRSTGEQFWSSPRVRYAMDSRPSSVNPTGEIQNVTGGRRQRAHVTRMRVRRATRVRGRTYTEYISRAVVSAGRARYRRPCPAERRNTIYIYILRKFERALYTVGKATRARPRKRLLSGNGKMTINFIKRNERTYPFNK